MDEADRIWNRACRLTFIRHVDAAPGDRALAGLLGFDSLAGNGGPMHAVECMSDGEFNAAVAGFRYFGLETVADFIEQLRHLDENVEDMEAWESASMKTYSDLLDEGHRIEHVFRERLASNPQDFASVDDMLVSDDPLSNRKPPSL